MLPAHLKRFFEKKIRQNWEYRKDYLKSVSNSLCVKFKETIEKYLFLRDYYVYTKVFSIFMMIKRKNTGFIFCIPIFGRVCLELLDA